MEEGVPPNSQMWGAEACFPLPQVCCAGDESASDVPLIQPGRGGEGGGCNSGG